MISKRTHRYLLIYAVLQFMVGSIIAQNDFSTTEELEKIKQYALRANDTTLLLLEDIRPSLNFDFTNDHAFEFFMIKTQFYIQKLRKVSIRESLAEAKEYYDRSDNDRLRIWYEIVNAFHLDSKECETELKACIKQAETLEIHDLLADAKKFLAIYYRTIGNINSAELYFKEAMDTALKYKLSIKQADILYAHAAFLFNNSKYDRALKLFDRSKTLYSKEGFNVRVANIVGYEANIFRNRAFYAESLEGYQKAFKVYEKYNQEYRLAFINRAIGNLFVDLGRDEEALEKFQLAINYISEESNPKIFGRLNRDIGDSYLALGNFKEAEIYLKRSIVVKNKFINDINKRSSYNSLGNLYLKQDKVNDAIFLFNKAIPDTDNPSSTVNLHRSFLGLMEAALLKNDFKKANFFGEKALSYSRANEALEIEHTILLHLSKINGTLKNYKQAAAYYEEANVLSERVLNYKDALKIADVEIKYENEKKELEILNLKLENQKKQGLINSAKQRTNFFILALILGLMVLFSLASNFIEKKRANAKLAKLNSALNASNEELESFALMASHDLKSPLRSITSFSSILQKKLTGKLDSKDQEYLNYITTSGNNLSFMIDDILAYSKVDSQNIVTTEVDLNIMLKDIMLILHDPAEQKSVSLKQLTSFPVAKVDEVKLKRVFLNLASNSIKFSDMEKDNRRIHFGYQEKDKYHQFSISDNGIGIPETDKNLFEPFTYLNSKDEYKGTGVGLAVCQKIIEKHGGKIWYESELGEETVFYFTIKKLNLES